MKRTSQLLGAVSAFALIGLSTPAMAEGTQAGQTITNTVTVNYNVGGVAQTAETASDTFTVDRRVNFTVVETGNGATSVSPGSSESYVTFEVTNLSNAALDFSLDVAQDGADDFNIRQPGTLNDGFQLYLDNPLAGTVGEFDAADTLITFLDEIPEDETVTVFVVGDIPGGTVTGNTANVTLTGTAAEAGTTGVLGADVVANTGDADDPNAVDTVFADTGNDGIESDTDTFVVSAAALTVSKTSRVISDPVSGVTNPKAIPGAVVEYCINVENGAGSATATGIQVTDVLVANLTFDNTFGVFVDATADVNNVCSGGTDSGTYTAGTRTVAGTLSDIAAGGSQAFYFRAIIDGDVTFTTP
ncbi:hypothetical protein HME9302_00901 [Alteripontixanthobacter maritimus]|uniref:DUF11 domain-containing protein n=1 Tax=Alteripontixanthobacter maritimus TaxID=2161824 RepID=A0A369Q9X7_9SPHN|nr:hypothetical protein [Alteripontixanthobacter maritimus]RDC59709.1 hypothetical protein HME9302_00901 [Alteripontixanthobacter maritimus]